MAITTKITYIGNNSTTIYSVPFEYLSRSHVIITVDGRAAEEYTWVTRHIIGFAAPPKTGTRITIQRQTPHDEPWVTWRDGSVMAADDLNAQQLQTLFVLQEYIWRLTTLEGLHEKITTSIASQEELLNLGAYSPIPFGGIYVDDEGILCITVYGRPASDTITINEDGELIINSLLPDYLGDTDDE